MFKPARILQAGLIMFSIAGCAAPPAPLSSNEKTSSTEESITHNKTANEGAPITVGDSRANRTQYHLADGSLSPWLLEWSNELATIRNIPIATVETLLDGVNYNAEVARLMAPSKGRVKRSWLSYQKRFVDPIRIRAGTEFWKNHRELLTQTETKYGVPASVIVAIIGVETVYGRYTGDFKALDALATLGFSYPDDSRPERGELFRNQLADLIDLHHQQKLNANQAYGSYAGAMGLPQFMPGSLMRYAVDGDNDGKIDLFNSMPDIVESVANFLITHGWRPGLPVFANASLPNDPASFVDGGLTPLSNWEALQNDGAKIQSSTHEAWQNRPLGVINLIDEPSSTVEYRIATENFFAITHYNRSYFYAASVSDLADELYKKVALGTP